VKHLIGKEYEPDEATTVERLDIDAEIARRGKINEARRLAAIETLKRKGTWLGLTDDVLRDIRREKRRKNGREVTPIRKAGNE